jgi:enamine deaminase RidA (YjgF/YER057c/UK114 family)
MTKAITPEHFPWFDYSRYSFSLGLQLGDTAYLSGHSASQYSPEKGRIVIEGDATDQTRTAYAKIEAILGAAGLTFDDVVRVVENVTKEGIDHYADMEKVRNEVFGSHRPAVNTVVIDSLLRPGALIEIEVTARKGAGAPYSIGSDGRASFANAHEVEDVVYLSTLHPYDENGELVGEGDPEEQVRQIFRNAQRTLEAVGLSTSSIVKTVDMVRPEALPNYAATGNPRREFLGPVYPVAAGILQSRVAADDRVLVSYDMIASRAELKAINPGWERYQKLTYSPAVLAGSTLFMSGQAALDPETEKAVLEGDVVAQARYTYNNIIAVLEAAGLGPENLVKTIEYVTPAGLPEYRGVAEVRKELLREPYPASTGIVCNGLLRRQFLIEIDPMAVVKTS